MPDIAKISGIEIANASKIMGIDKASIAKIDGQDVPSGAPGVTDDVFRLKLQNALTNIGSNSDTASATGTVQYAPGVDGYEKTAFDFDGSTNIKSTSAVAPLPGALPFTLCAWIRPEGNGAIIHNADDAAEKGLALFKSTSSGKFGIALFDGSSTTAASEAVASVNDQWYHVIATWDGTTGANGLKLYVSTVDSDNTGSPAAQATAASTNLTPTTGVLTIGSRENDASPLYFNGQICDVRVFDRVLSSSELSTVRSELLSTVADAVLDLPLDGSISNFGSNGDTGTVTGTTAYRADRDGRANSAFDFDGASRIDFTTDVAPTSTTDAFTYAVVFKPDGVSGNQELLTNFSAATLTGFQLRLSGTDLQFRAGTAWTLDVAAGLSAGTEYICFIEWDGTTNANGVKIYLSEFGSDATATPIGQATSSVSTLDPAGTLKIGANRSNANFFNGSMTRVKAFDRILSAAEKSEEWANARPTSAVTHTKAIDLDGSTEYLRNTTSQSIGVANAWSFNAILKDLILDGTSRYVFRAAGSSNTNDIIILVSSTETRVEIRRSAGGTFKDYRYAALSGSTTYSLGVRWNGTTLAFLIDGVVQTPTSTPTDNADSMSDGNRQIGVSASQAGTQILGCIYKSVALWNVAMTDAEFLEIANNNSNDLRFDFGNYASSANLKHQWLIGRDSESIGRDFVDSGQIDIGANAANITVADIVDF